MKASITALSKRIGAVEESQGRTGGAAPEPLLGAVNRGTFRNLKAEIDKKTGHNLGEEFEALLDLPVIQWKIRARGQRSRNSCEPKTALAQPRPSGNPERACSPIRGGDLDSLSKSNEQVLDQLTNQHQRTGRGPIRRCQRALADQGPGMHRGTSWKGVADPMGIIDPTLVCRLAGPGS
eukprot:Skav235351  [mRNA]  locus=scaffold5912:82577:84753:- [translate_table: standard]